MLKVHKRSWKGAAARRLRALADNAPSVELAARIVAERLLEGIQCPPTDLTSILSRVNISACESSSEYGGSGALLRDGKSFRILYSSTMPLGRQRWTIAHEVAHAIIENTGRNAPRTGDELERLCDIIAAELLLPWKCFTPRIRADTCLDSVFRLAYLYKTSVLATAIRAAEVCDVSVFEMDSRQLRRRRGKVRSEYDIATEPSLKMLVLASTKSDSGSDEFDAMIGGRFCRWIGEWRRIGSAGRRIFMLRPLR